MENSPDVGVARLQVFREIHPREIHVLPALPLTPIGKIDRKAPLRELLTSHEGATT
jgi:non-ribosomal peptide synthetase component E (peptide arylation enzyme)